MLIKDKKLFSIGVVMAVSFFVLFLIIMSPLFDGKNGLEYADDLFNKLSKGSAYYVPKVAESNKKFIGKMFNITIRLEDAKDAEQIDRFQRLMEKNNFSVIVQGQIISISGDVGLFLQAAIRDANYMYMNDGEKLRSLYGYDEKRALKDWWVLLSKVDKALQLKGEFDSASMVNEVNKKLVETSYNYYGIESQKVTEKMGVMTGLLVFYVLYTMWWGYALYNLFEGLGLTTKKKKVKKEI